MRKVTIPAPILTTPTISLSGLTSVAAGTTVTVTATIANAGSSYLVHWMNRGTEFAATTTPSVTYTKGAATDTITARVVSTAVYGCYDSTVSGKHEVTDKSLGLRSPVPKTELTIFPNPVSGDIHVSGLQGGGHYRLMNTVGSVLMEGDVDHVIDARNVARGVYLLEVEDRATGMRMTGKIIVGH